MTGILNYIKNTIPRKKKAKLKRKGRGKEIENQIIKESPKKILNKRGKTDPRIFELVDFPNRIRVLCLWYEKSLKEHRQGPNHLYMKPKSGDDRLTTKNSLVDDFFHSLFFQTSNLLTNSRVEYQQITYLAIFMNVLIYLDGGWGS